MTDNAIEARREYHRRWQQNNKDKVRNYQVAYWERQAAEAEASEQGERMPGQQAAGER